MAEILIEGIGCHHRDIRENEGVLYVEYPKDEQYFRKIEHPFTDDELINIANKEHSYTSQQKSWVEEQEKIFDDGLYVSINGGIKFIPGAYWCYINFWTLEHGETPEYREDDRLFFIFHEYLRLETEALGCTRLKGRRQGATSIAMFFMWFIAGRGEHKLCGLTSFTDTAAQEAYQLMFAHGFRALLPCFQADFDSDSENFIRFVKPVDKKRKSVLAVKREGLNSYCNYKSNAMNSYDSGRQSYNVPDEAGKRGSKININSYWSRLYKTMLVGFNKVGFGYLPTTVGQKKEGGENYKIFWENASQYKIDKATGKPYGLNTPNRCVQFFMSATRCYAGYIDKFGNSIVDDPIEPVLNNKGVLIKEGAKTVILRDRAKLEGDQKMEHQRDYPLDVFDAFAFEAGVCEFNSEMLTARIKYLSEYPEYLRPIRLSDTKKYIEPQFPGQKRKLIREISYMDDETTGWLLFEKPEKENHFTQVNNIYSVNSPHKYIIGADTKRIWSSTNGSDATICVFKTSCVINGVETGNYPVAFYIGQPKLPSFFYEEIIKACLWYGGCANIERSAGDHFNEYFYKQGMEDLLLWTPARNPVKQQPILVGTESASPFELAAQLECAKIYFDGNNPDMYNGNINRVVFPHLLQQALEYNHSERTPYDSMIALMMCLLVALKAPMIKRPELRPKQLLPTYKNEYKVA